MKNKSAKPKTKVMADKAEDFLPPCCKPEQNENPNTQKNPLFPFWKTMTILLAAILLTLWFTKLSENGFSLENLDPRQLTQKISVPQISPAELKSQIVAKDFFLINVHKPYEGEIAKTDAFIEYDKIEENQNYLPKDKSAKIIVYCKTGQMSKTAIKKLTALGYINVSHLDGGMQTWEKAGNKTINVEKIKQAVIPEKGFSAPITWGNLGPNLISSGVIDLEKFKKTVNPTSEQLAILEKGSNEKIIINQANAQFIVDVLWAMGLGQKSKVYTDGPMGKEYKSQIGNFASTGGWTLAKGDAVHHLNRYDFVSLSDDQQNRVFEIAKNVYRPCCGNSTHFPDCNHGMAALSLIELMVAQNYSDEEIYKTILGFNSVWFTQNYISLAAYFAQNGTAWDKVDAKKALGQEFSSGQGAAKISQEVGRLPYLYGQNQGGSCGA